jgi:hypothetical protein
MEVVPQTRQERRLGPRTTRVVVRKVGPWSVFKFSILFYFCVLLVVLGGLTILWWILEAIGVIDQLESFIADLFADQSFRINAWWLFQRAFLVGAFMVLLGALINLFIAFLYNLISDIVGGIELTLSERRTQP